MRESPNISEEQLRSCLQGQYNLYPVTLEFLPRGRDFNAGVYRVVSQQDAVYLLKVKSGPFYEPSCLVPRYLNKQGVTSVVAPIPTVCHELWTKLADWTAIVYPFIDGITTITGMTDAQWQETGAIFKQIHQALLSPAGFGAIRREAFDPTGYAQWVCDFETRQFDSQPIVSEAARALHTSWMAHQRTIHQVLTSLETLAKSVRLRTLTYVICHADLHAVNLIRDHAGHVFVIDWDDVMLAPPERDFIFVREPQATAFWDGYGHCEVDWVALTYFRFERVIQDIIENARNAFLRDDLAEETRAYCALSFLESFTEAGSNLSAAYASATHLPEGVNLYTT
jgi:spectinomycin phosphotransferase